MLNLLLLSAIAMMPGVDAKPINLGEQFIIKSKVMDEDRTILVALPQGYRQGGASYPVLYLTDGDGHLQHTAGTIAFLARQNRIPEMIVVGITNTDRTRDLTPKPTAQRMPTSGGADRFLEFFEKELFTQIEKRYRTQPYRVFAGHSLGGLFAIHALLDHTDMFDAYLSVSPSLWWGEFDPLDRADAFLKKQKSLDKGLFVTLGNERADMREGYNRMVKLLETNNVEGLRWGNKLYEEENHNSVVLLSHYDGLNALFEFWRPPANLGPQGFDGLVSHYNTISKRMGYKVIMSENLGNRLGYMNLGNNNMAEAIKAFEWNAKHYPKSANVYDSLAEAYEKAGRLKDAHKNFKKAYKLAKKVDHANTGIYRTNMERVEAAMKK